MGLQAICTQPLATLTTSQNKRGVSLFSCVQYCMVIGSDTTSSMVIIISRTLGQCLNETNSSGKNAYHTFLKYLQVSFQLGLRTQPTLNFNNSIEGMFVFSPMVS